MGKKKPEFPKVMLVGEVAKVLGVTDERVRQLDDELEPMRTEGKVRYYDPVKIKAYAAARAAAKEKKQHA